MSDKIRQVSDADFDQQVLRSNLPVLVDFYADWCVPCKRLAPILDDMAAEFDGEVVILKVNVDTDTEIRDRYSVRGIPALMLFKGGEMVARSSTHQSRSDVAEFLGKHLDGGDK